jgi:hypothetical protein
MFGLINSVPANDALADLCRIIGNPQLYSVKISKLQDQHRHLEKRAAELHQWEQRLKRKEAQIAALLAEHAPRE